ncbi:hypothetical protein [Burkholderia sp. Tr-20390]|uniref:hypothetical protein n=1 Tax=Burkholderia sp. Tr-20390 TaxID=2703904 RepID=UPI001981ED79|nr:hypothetical protein [Burkholderia sp. Tr-20390]MBN3733152.1 hypothetical protein [Burkholderia sp. Tr-20390]
MRFLKSLDRLLGVGVVARILITILAALTWRMVAPDAYFLFGRWIMAAVVVLEIVYDAYLSFQMRRHGGNAQ